MIFSYGGKNVPFDASVAMVTARVFLWKERQNGNVRLLCNFGWHPGCINVKFLFLESTCSQMACVLPFTSRWLGYKLTIVLLIPLEVRSRNLSQSFLRWNYSTKAVVDTCLKMRVCQSVTVTLPETRPFNPTIFQILAGTAASAVFCDCSL